MSNAKSRTERIDHVRPTSNRTYAVLAWLLALMFEISFVVSGGLGDLFRYGAYPLLLAALAWVVFWQPAVAVGPRSVSLVNVISSVTIPYSRISGITTRWGLGVEVDDAKVFTAWAAPSRSVWNRRKATEAAAAADEGLMPASSIGSASRGEAISPGEPRIHADADSLAAAIQERMALAEASEGDGDTVRTVANSRELLVLAVVAAFCLATYLLT